MVVLFPQTIVPLHIFEPRYRAMVEDALKGDRLIAMALLKPGWETDYEGAPPVHEILGVGKIVREERLEDGRFNILLQGVTRARIEEQLPPSPYRRARITVLREPPTGPSPVMERLRLGLLAVYSTILKNAVRSEPVQIQSDLTLGALCDRLAAILDVDVLEKQAVLEALDPAQRAERALEMLRRSPIAGGPVASGLREARKRSWPPEPPSN